MISPRNPLANLPSVRLIADLDVESKAFLRALLTDLRGEAQRLADLSWRRHKGPMAAYWKAVAVYAGHTARLLR